MFKGHSGATGYGSMLAGMSLLLSTVVPGATPQPAATEITPMTPDVASYEEARPQADYVKRVAMIPMRDGVKLYTVIVMKKGTRNGPILLSRTPYDAKDDTERTKSQSIVDILPAMDAEFVLDNYIRVYQDIRGMHNSEGQFIMTRPIRGPLNTPASMSRPMRMTRSTGWSRTSRKATATSVSLAAATSASPRSWPRSIRTRRSRPRSRRARWWIRGSVMTTFTTAPSGIQPSTTSSRRVPVRAQAPTSRSAQAMTTRVTWRRDRRQTTPGCGVSISTPSIRSCCEIQPIRISGRCRRWTNGWPRGR